MDVVIGTSGKGKQTVIYRNFEYVKERENCCRKIVNTFIVFVLCHSYARRNVAGLSVAQLTVAPVNCRPMNCRRLTVA